MLRPGDLLNNEILKDGNNSCLLSHCIELHQLMGHQFIFFYKCYICLCLSIYHIYIFMYKIFTSRVLDIHGKRMSFGEKSY